MLTQQFPHIYNLVQLSKTIYWNQVELSFLKSPKSLPGDDKVFYFWESEGYFYQLKNT